MIGEYLTGAGRDAQDGRGCLWADFPGYSQVYTQLTPNSSSPDLLYPDLLLQLPVPESPLRRGDRRRNRQRRRAEPAPRRRQRAHGRRLGPIRQESLSMCSSGEPWARSAPER